MMLAYAKTARGMAEVETRADRLNPRLRRLLILVDGHKPLDQLKTLLGLDAIEEAIEQLEQGGYIESVSSADEQGDEALDEELAPDLSALPAERAPGDLDKARNYIINTLKHFHGPYTKLDLMREAQACETHAQLRALYPEWLRCMNESTMAARRIGELNTELFAVL